MPQAYSNPTDALRHAVSKGEPIGRITDYDARYLNREASRIARAWIVSRGGGRIVGRVAWAVRLTAIPGGDRVTLRVSFAANLKDGNCGLYETSEIL